jgi:hypothetical protein
MVHFCHAKFKPVLEFRARLIRQPAAPSGIGLPLDNAADLKARFDPVVFVTAIVTPRPSGVLPICCTSPVNSTAGLREQRILSAVACHPI